MELEIRSAGRGAPVVFLHGCPTTSTVLDGIAARVATFAATHVVSLPGYGKSPPLTRPFRVADIHDAIESALLSRGLTRVSLVGFSGGGYHAIALAGRQNVHVSTLVLLASLAGLSAEDRAGFGDSATALEQGVDLRDLAAPRFLGASARTPQNVAAVRDWIVATPAQNLAAELRALAASDDLTQVVRAFPGPVLARVGAEDVATPPAKSEAIVRAAQRGTLHIVPNVGHALPLEDADATADDVARALGGD